MALSLVALVFVALVLDWRIRRLEALVGELRDRVAELEARRLIVNPRPLKEQP